MFTLAIQAGKVAQAPYVASPRVSNPRSGFFEMEQFRSVLKHLRIDLRPVVEFAYLTGWRRGEILGVKAGVEKLARLHVEQSEPAKVVVVLADRKNRT